MHQEMIVYISKATRPLSAAEVQQIAALSAERNRKADITGLLLQIGDYFVQALEGDAEKLAPLLKKIQADNRHNEVQTIYRMSDQPRIFTQWNMGFFNIEKHYQASRQDVAQLRQFAQKAFAADTSSREAIAHLIKSIPALMKKWEVEDRQPLAA